jgi:hypothetical protein
VYLPSAAIALARLSPMALDRGFFAATFAIADEVAPAAKIGFALLMALMLFAARKLSNFRRGTTLALDIALACVAMCLVIALLPADWSRGFGVGLSGVRFAPEVTLVYLASAAASGLAFHLSERKCVGRHSHSPSDLKPG